MSLSSQSVTGLLTTAQREFLRGESSVENPVQYRRNIRYNVRNRIEEIEEDLQLLDDVDEGELREEFFTQFDRHRRMESEIDELRREVARLRQALAEAEGVSPDVTDTPKENSNEAGDELSGTEDTDS